MFTPDFLSIFDPTGARQGRTAAITASRWGMGMNRQGRPTQATRALVSAAQSIMAERGRGARSQERTVGGQTIRGKSQARDILNAARNLGVTGTGRGRRAAGTAAGVRAAQGRMAERRARARQRRR